MKSKFQPLATHLWVLLFLPFMEHTAIAEGPGAGLTICFTPTLTYQAASGSHSKLAFEEFYEGVRPCPIGIFRTNQYVFTETVTLTPNQGPTSGAHTNIMTWGYDKVTEQYSESSRWIDITSDCSYDTDDPSHGDPNCGLTYSDLRDQFSLLWGNYFNQTP